MGQSPNTLDTQKKPSKKPWASGGNHPFGIVWDGKMHGFWDLKNQLSSHKPRQPPSAESGFPARVRHPCQSPLFKIQTLKFKFKPLIPTGQTQTHQPEVVFYGFFYPSNNKSQGTTEVWFSSSLHNVGTNGHYGICSGSLFFEP